MVLERQRVVIDASLAINFVIPTQPYHAKAVALLRQWARDQVGLVAPPLFESESDSVIRRYVYTGLLEADAGGAAHELLVSLPILIIQESTVRERARQIAGDFSQDRVCDATYCALAENLRCEFWTADESFYRAVKGALSYVRFVGEVAAPSL